MADNSAGRLPVRASRGTWGAAWWAIPVALLFVPLVGCQEPDGLAAVSGTVTVDGAPAESGQIDFFPAPGAGNPVGTKIVNGVYRARAPIGESNIQIRVPKVVGQKKLYDTPDSPVRDILAESLPEKYNEASELWFEVQPGANVKDFDLKTDG